MGKHITQTDDWAKFRLTTPNVKKVLEFGTTKIYFHKIPHTPFTVAYIPRSDVKINEELKNLCKKENAIFLKIEPNTFISNFTLRRSTESFQISNSILPQHTIYIDLTKTEDELLKEMHEKTRYNIKLAQKKGVEIKRDDNPDNFIKLLEKTESRQGFYSHNTNYYKKLWKIIKPVILTAYVNKNPIASIMLFKSDDFLYYPYGGSDPNFKEYMAPSLLHWEAIKLGKKLGCKTYDLWGTYKNTKDEKDPWYGIYRFKSGFGGTEVDFPPSIDIPLSPLYPIYIFMDHVRWMLLKLKRIFKF